jgi:hypothetical protein
MEDCVARISALMACTCVFDRGIVFDVHLNHFAWNTRLDLRGKARYGSSDRKRLRVVHAIQNGQKSEEPDDFDNDLPKQRELNQTELDEHQIRAQAVDNIQIGGKRTPTQPATLMASAQGLWRFFAKTPGMAATIKIKNKTPKSRIERIASETTSRTLTIPVESCLCSGAE